MSRWYRAYEGTVTDAKLHEAALVAEVSRSVVIASWHCLLEACSAARSPRFETTPRRVAAILGEPLKTAEAVFAAFDEVGLTAGGEVIAWSRRQFESDSSTERSRKHRESKRNVAATLQQHHATPPDTDTDTDTDRSSLRSDLSETSSDASPDFEFEKPEAAPVTVEAEPKAKRPRKSYPEEFEQFWRAYPTDPLMSKSEAAKAWGRLTGDDQRKAASAVSAFARHCANTPDYRPVHACRFLSQRRFDGFAAAEAAAPAGRPATFASEEEALRWWHANLRGEVAA